MRLRRLIISVILLCPSVVAGQSLRSANVVAIPVGVVRITDKAAVAQQLTPMSWQSAFDDSVVSRKSMTLRGAIIGAVVGGVVGAVAGSQVNTGCMRDPCNSQAKKVQFTVGLAGVGSLIGAGVGALIGRLSSKP
jgi:hypothetical protein